MRMAFPKYPSSNLQRLATARECKFETSLKQEHHSHILNDLSNGRVIFLEVCFDHSHGPIGIVYGLLVASQMRILNGSVAQAACSTACISLLIELRVYVKCGLKAIQSLIMLLQGAVESSEFQQRRGDVWVATVVNPLSRLQRLGEHLLCLGIQAKSVANASFVTLRHSPAMMQSLGLAVLFQRLVDKIKGNGIVP